MVECEHEHPPILPTTPSSCLEPVNCCAGRGGQALTFNPTDQRNTLNNQQCKRNNNPVHCKPCAGTRRAGGGKSWQPSILHSSGYTCTQQTGEERINYSIFLDSFIRGYWSDSLLQFPKTKPQCCHFLITIIEMICRVFISSEEVAIAIKACE